MVVFRCEGGFLWLLTPENHHAGCALSLSEPAFFFLNIEVRWRPFEVQVLEGV
jgi:hypothetical protein